MPSTSSSPGLLPRVKQDLVMLDRGDPETRRAAMDSLKGYVGKLNCESMPQFLDRVDSKDAPPFAISLFAEVARVHREAAAPFVPRIASAVVQSLRSAGAGVGAGTGAPRPLLQQACARVVVSVARYVAKDEPEVFRQLCGPLAVALSDRLECLAIGVAECLRSLVESEKWRFAPGDVADELVLKAAAAIERGGSLAVASTATVAHMQLLRSLARLNPDSVRPYAATLLKSGSRILRSATKSGGPWQRRAVAAQLLGSILTIADKQSVVYRLPLVIRSLQQSRLDPIAVVRNAACTALNAAKSLAGESDFASYLQSPPPSTPSRPRSSQSRTRRTIIGNTSQPFQPFQPFSRSMEFAISPTRYPLSPTMPALRTRARSSSDLQHLTDCLTHAECKENTPQGGGDNAIPNFVDPGMNELFPECAHLGESGQGGSNNFLTREEEETLDMGDKADSHLNQCSADQGHFDDYYKTNPENEAKDERPPETPSDGHSDCDSSNKKEEEEEGDSLWNGTGQDSDGDSRGSVYENESENQDFPFMASIRCRSKSLDFEKESLSDEEDGVQCNAISSLASFRYMANSQESKTEVVREGVMLVTTPRSLVHSLQLVNLTPDSMETPGFFARDELSDDGFVAKDETDDIGSVARDGMGDAGCVARDEMGDTVFFQMADIGFAARDETDTGFVARDEMVDAGSVETANVGFVARDETDAGFVTRDETADAGFVVREETVDAGFVAMEETETANVGVVVRDEMDGADCVAGDETADIGFVSRDETANVGIVVGDETASSGFVARKEMEMADTGFVARDETIRAGSVAMDETAGAGIVSRDGMAGACYVVGDEMADAGFVALEEMADTVTVVIDVTADSGSVVRDETADAGFVARNEDISFVARDETNDTDFVVRDKMNDTGSVAIGEDVGAVAMDEDVGSVVRDEMDDAGFVAGDKMADASFVSRDETVEVDFVSWDERIDVGFVAKDEITDTVSAVKNETTNIGFAAMDQMTNIGFVARDDAMDAGFVARDEMANAGFVCRDGMIDIGFVAMDETGNAGFVCRDEMRGFAARDEKVDVGFVSSDEKADAGFVARKKMADAGFVARDDTADDGFVARDETADLGFVARDKTADVGFVARDKRADLGFASFVVRDKTAEDGFIARDEMAEVGFVARDEMTDDGFAGFVVRDEMADPGFVARDEMSNPGFVERDEMADPGFVARNETTGVGFVSWDEMTGIGFVAMDETADVDADRLSESSWSVRDNPIADVIEGDEQGETISSSVYIRLKTPTPSIAGSCISDESEVLCDDAERLASEELAQVSTIESVVVHADSHNHGLEAIGQKTGFSIKDYSAYYKRLRRAERFAEMVLHVVLCLILILSLAMLVIAYINSEHEHHVLVPT